MVDFKVREGINSFRFRGRRYKPKDVISASTTSSIEQLRNSPLVQEIPVSVVAPVKTVDPVIVETPKAPETKQQKKKRGRK
jgi:hypothetical protein